MTRVQERALAGGLALSMIIVTAFLWSLETWSATEAFPPALERDATMIVEVSLRGDRLAAPQARPVGSGALLVRSGLEWEEDPPLRLTLAYADPGPAIVDPLQRLTLARAAAPEERHGGAEAHDSGDESDHEPVSAVPPPAADAISPPAQATRPAAAAHHPILPMPKSRPATIGKPLAFGAPLAAVPTPQTAPAPPAGPRLAALTPPSTPSATPSVVLKTPFGVPYVLQTTSVDMACVKPELVAILQKVEAKYGQKVVVTSAFRSRGRQGSLHARCLAVDLIVPGMAASDVARFLRTIPEAGGVGTYCHPHLVHLDLGEARDWKYGCGSYFALRD